MTKSEIIAWLKKENKLAPFDDIEKTGELDGCEIYSFSTKDGKGYGKTFYPDYIVKFTDGRIGIFDTKSGWTAESAGQKAQALQKYISEHADLNLFGGIMNVINECFYLNQSAEYEFSDGVSGDWKLFEL